MSIPAYYQQHPPMSRPGRVRRRRLYHSPKRRDWMPWETDRLIQLVEAGFSYDQIAKKTGRTRTGVTLKCRRLNVRITTTPATLSARDVAKLLGMSADAKAPKTWITRGWLPARDAGGTGHKALWRIQWEDLTDFLERRDYWMAWHPERITDLALREWTQEIRAGQPRWITAGELARRFRVTRETPHQWVTKGLLPATKYGNFWFWEGDLVGFTAPCERSRVGRHLKKVSLQTQVLPLLQSGPQTAESLAGALGANPRSVQQALRTLARRGQVRRVADVVRWRRTSFGRVGKLVPSTRGTLWEVCRD